MIEDIISLWREDSKLDDTELDLESLKIPNLHAKYLKLLAENKVKLKALRVKQKQLYNTLYNYYKGDMNNKEDLAILKREPWPKTVLKQDMPMYIDADDDEAGAGAYFLLRHNDESFAECSVKPVDCMPNADPVVLT